MNYFQFISEYKSVFPDNSYDQMMQAWRESGYAPAPAPSVLASAASEIEYPPQKRLRAAVEIPD